MILDLICGARPNFMKIAPIIQEIDRNKKYKRIDYRIIHTGQHYDYLMSKKFFDDLKLPRPKFNLNVGSGSHSEQTAKIMIGYEKIILKKPPDLCIVVGDVNSTLACSVVCKKYNIQLAHIEAGLRSGDQTMPEEINRIVTDSLSDIFFTTSKLASKNLVKEGKNKSSIHFVGNTMIDTLINFKKVILKPGIFEKLNLMKKKYFLLTLHRPSNVDEKSKLMNILNEISNACKNHLIIFPAHPRVYDYIKSKKTIPKNIKIIRPLGYLDFLFFLKESQAIITDSGGITEEATYLKIPCLTIRNSTERPETITIGSNELIGEKLSRIDFYIKKILSKKWKNSRIPEKWDGKTAKRILRIISKK